MYITVAEYTSITVATPTANVDANVLKASRLLDQRIGMYSDGSTSLEDAGWKLSHNTDANPNVTVFPELTARESSAVQEWVAFATKFLEDHGALLGQTGDIQLGRFRKRVDAGMEWKRHLALHDANLVDANMVRLSLGPELAPNDSWLDYY